MVPGAGWCYIFRVGPLVIFNLVKIECVEIVEPLAHRKVAEMLQTGEADTRKQISGSDGSEIFRQHRLEDIVHNVSRRLRVMQQAYSQCQHGSVVALEKLFYVALCRHTYIKTATSQKPNPCSKKIQKNFLSQEFSPENGT